MPYQTNSKSQIFMLDLIVAVVLIVVSLGIFFTFFINTDSQADMYDVVSQLTESMSSTKINDLNNQFVRDLFIDQEIRNIDNTILQQVSEFENTGRRELAQNLTKELTNVYIQDKIGYNITLKTSVSGTPIILDSSQRYASREEAKAVASIQRQVTGFNETDFYIHQYNFEVWRGE
jgi:flagellar basal body-associated protein FliL